MRFDRGSAEQIGIDWEIVEGINRDLDDLSAMLVDRIDRRDYQSGRAWGLALLQQALCYRIVDLFETTIFLAANKRWLMTVIGARSALETVALNHYVLGEIKKAVEAKDADRFDAFVLQQLFSMKTGFASAPPPTHILTAIDRLAKTMKRALGTTMVSPSMRIQISKAPFTSSLILTENRTWRICREARKREGPLGF